MEKNVDFDIHDQAKVKIKEKKKSLFVKMGESIDFFFNKLLPKKFIVFTFACFLVFRGDLEGEQWFWIAAIYMGVNATAKLTGGLGNYFKEKNNIKKDG